MQKNISTMNLLDLPDCMLEQILECLSYDEIAKQRIVSSFGTINLKLKERRNRKNNNNNNGNCVRLSIGLPKIQYNMSEFAQFRIS